MIMLLLLLLIGTIIMTTALAALFRKKMELMLPLTIFGNILVSYLVGMLAPSLAWGFYANLLLYAAALGYVIYLLIKEKRRVLEALKSPGLLVWTILFVYIIVINWGRVYSSWDEFSHWGLVVKNMYLFDSFSNHEYSTVTFGEYPPALALWQYFVTRLCGTYSESAVYMATGWFVAALCTPLVSRFSGKKIVAALFSALVLIFMPLIFYPSYLVLLYVDPFLGILLGYILVFDYISEKRDVFYCINMFATISVLCLVKTTGAFLALVAIAIIVASDILRKRAKANIRIWCVLLAGVLFGKYSWDLYLQITGFQAAWNTGGVSMQNVVSLLTGGMQKYQRDSIMNFIDALSDYKFGGRVVTMYLPAWIALFIILFLLIVHVSCGEEKKKHNRCLMAGMLCGFGIFVVSLQVLYLFTYNSTEAVVLASFERYISTFLVAIAYVILGVLTVEFANKGKGSQAVAVGMCSLLFFMPLSYIFDVTILSPIHCNKSVAYREEHLQIEQYTDMLDYTKDKVMYISQEDNGIDKMILSYLIAPVESDGSLWSFGGPYVDIDNWSKTMTPQELLEHLDTQGCTYVYVFGINDYFTETFGELFEVEQIQEKAMYRYVQEEGRLKLVVR